MSDFDQWSPQLMAERMTPRQAARINARVFMLRCATDRESLAATDPIADNDGEHRWFVYCLNTVARRA